MKEGYLFLREIGIDLALVFTGLIGGSMMLSNTKRKLSFGQKFLMVGSGALLANYVTPLILWSFGMPVQLSGAISFLVGFFGLEFIKRLLLKYLDSKIKNDI
jgi:hypothetical protein